MSREEKENFGYAWSCAKKYRREKRRYKTSVEKKALKIAEKLRKSYFMEELNELNEAERKTALTAYRVFRFRVELKRNLLVCGIVIALLSIIASLA